MIQGRVNGLIQMEMKGLKLSGRRRKVEAGDREEV